MNVKRLLEVWERADQATRDAGAAWYPDAHVFAADLAHRYDLTIPVTAGVIAALSPQLRWQRNKDFAEQYLQGLAVPHFRVCLKRAGVIVQDGDGWRAFGPHAPKSFCFWRNIVVPTSGTWVTIDRHAYSVWLGEKVNRPKMPDLTRAGRYWEVMTDYKTAARQVGCIPCAFQATLWLMQPKGKVRSPEPAYVPKFGSNGTAG